MEKICGFFFIIHFGQGHSLKSLMCANDMTLLLGSKLDLTEINRYIGRKSKGKER